MADAGLVGGSGGGGVAEPGLHVDHDAVGRGRLSPGPGPDLRLPPAADLSLQPGGQLRSGMLDLALHIPLHDALADAEQTGYLVGAALVLAHQVTHLRPGGLGHRACERPLDRPAELFFNGDHPPYAPYSPVSRAVTSPVLM